MLDEHYIQNQRDDLCASVQHTLVNTLMENLKRVKTGVVTGVVLAVTELRQALSKKWIGIRVPPWILPDAAMIAVVGHQISNNTFMH